MMRPITNICQKEHEEKLRQLRFANRKRMYFNKNFQLVGCEQDSGSVVYRLKKSTRVHNKNLELND